LNRRRMDAVVAALWVGFAGVGATGFGTLAWTLFRPPLQAPAAPLPEFIEAAPSTAKAATPSTPPALPQRRLTRKIPERQGEAPQAPNPSAAPLDSVVRLRGWMNYSGRRPSVAILELMESRKTLALEAGERIGKSGAVLREVGETIIVEYNGQRYKLTYKGAVALPGQALGDSQ
jgi:hypothetical protein